MNYQAILVGGALVASYAVGAAAQDLAVVNAQIVDPATRQVTPGVILIEDGVITGKVEQLPAGYTGAVIDVDGRWLIPALHDLHTHSVGNQSLGRAGDFVGTAAVSKRMLFAGVGGFLDLFNREETILSLRDRQRSGEIEGADIFAAGPCLTATKGHCTEYGVPTRVIDSPADSRREVGDLATKHPDVVKIVYDHDSSMPSIDYATLESAIETARLNGITTVVHIGSWNDAYDAVRAGASAITHLDSAEPVPDSLVSLMVERGTFAIPTLAVSNEIANFAGRPELLESSLLQAVTTQEVIAGYRDTTAYPDWAKRRISRSKESRERQFESMRRLARAGVQLLTGTDAGNVGVIQGYSVHRELALFVEAGLSPWDALAASTVGAGRFLGRKYGVAPGDEASFVVLDGSPISDIRNTERIHSVIHHGVVIDRERLLQR